MQQSLDPSRILDWQEIFALGGSPTMTATEGEFPWSGAKAIKIGATWFLQGPAEAIQNTKRHIKMLQLGKSLPGPTPVVIFH